MKVLIHTYDISFQNIGSGVKNRIVELVKGLKQYGIEVEYFDKYKTQIKDYDILHIFRLDRASKELVDYATSLGVKVVISSIVSLDKGWVVNFYWGIRKLPIATVYRELFSICSKADAIIAETYDEEEYIKKYYRFSKEIRVIPNGVETIEYYEKDIYKKIGGMKQYALIIGRFDANKNQLNVIKALKNTDIDVVFIGGETPIEQEYYKKCQKEAKGSKNLYFLGWLKKDDKLFKSTITNAKVIICSSYKETFGLALIEGIISGAIPVVSKHIPILKYKSLKGKCITFSPNNLIEIRNSVKKGMEINADLNFIKDVKKEFSWGRVIDSHLKIYQDILGEE